jgi:hypothetical protein
LLTSGTGEHLVCQVLPNVGEYEGQTGLSPPVVYPSTMGNEANEGSL